MQARVSSPCYQIFVRSHEKDFTEFLKNLEGKICSFLDQNINKREITVFRTALLMFIPTDAASGQVQVAGPMCRTFFVGGPRTDGWRLSGSILSLSGSRLFSPRFSQHIWLSDTWSPYHPLNPKTRCSWQETQVLRSSQRSFGVTIKFLLCLCSVRIC